MEAARGTIPGIWGSADLRGYKSALLAVLASAGLLVANQWIATTAMAKAGHKGHHAGGKRTAAEKSKEKKWATHKDPPAMPMSLAPPQAPAALGATSPTLHDGSGADYSLDQPTAALPALPALEISDSDLALVKNAIEGLHHHGAEKAIQIEGAISDPVARKLVEWIILRSENGGAESARYLAFIAANPSWPCLKVLRSHAEAMLWVEHPKPAQVLEFFNGSPPQTAKGRLALSRALLAQGNSEIAQKQVREAWRNDAMSADLESQVIKSYSEFLTRADHRARMERRLFAGDSEGAMRAAHRLGGAAVAIARALDAVHGKGNPSKLVAAVPAEAHQDAGYLLAHAHVLRHENKVVQAAQVMLSAPGDPEQMHDPEGWWVERRVLSRKLLDIGDARSAYLVVRDAAEPTKENSRVEHHFMAGWIALRYLHDPATARAHFARIQDVSAHPTSLARSHYWLGRTAEAEQQLGQARAEYQAGARSSAAYYGQLARARLGLKALAIAPPAPAEDRTDSDRLELLRAAAILYALNERNLIIPLMADLGDKLDDVGVLSALGSLAEQHQDARGMLHLGKAALARGLPLHYYAFPTVSVPQYSPIAPDIERAMLFAIIRQESMFNPDDWSAAQAVGLMQVTPTAGRDTCKRFHCKYDFTRLKRDMPYNLQLGAAELAGVMQDYGGNYVLTFAAYNAGRGRVSEWIRQFGDPRDPKVDPVDWVERIPIMETRNYVQRVMENMQVYRARFGGKVPFAIEADMRRGAAAN